MFWNSHHWYSWVLKGDSGGGGGGGGGGLSSLTHRPSRRQCEPLWSFYGRVGVGRGGEGMANSSDEW